MKRKNQYLLIGIAVALVIIGLLLWLLRRQAEINKEHISINFEVHNCASVETNKELLRNDFLMPLLMHSFVKEASGLENLIIPSVSSNKLDFSIPVIGINSFRYNSNAESLRLSNITSTSRQDDEKTFFSNWEAVGYADIEQSLLKGNPKNENNKELPSLYDIIQSENDDVFPDSIIIDKNCSDEILNQNKPYIFKSTADLRAYLNEILEKNPKAIEKSTVDSKIHLFLYCGEEAYLLNPNDRDNDGVINEKDNCPDVAGEKSNSGCPENNDDEDEVDEIEITTTVNNPSESNKVSNVCLGSDRRLTWEGQMRSLKIRITSSEINDINKVVTQNQSISFSNEERENITQINPKRTPIKVEYFDPIKRKYKAVNVNTASDNIIHCYNLLP